MVERPKRRRSHQGLSSLAYRICHNGTLIHKYTFGHSHDLKLPVARRVSGFPFFVNCGDTGEVSTLSHTHLSQASMEEIFSDALGLFGAETVEDDGYVHYGGLKLGVIPKVSMSPRMVVIHGL